MLRLYTTDATKKKVFAQVPSYGVQKEQSLPKVHGDTVPAERKMMNVWAIINNVGSVPDLRSIRVALENKSMKRCDVVLRKSSGTIENSLVSIPGEFSADELRMRVH